MVCLWGKKAISFFFFFQKEVVLALATNMREKCGGVRKKLFFLITNFTCLTLLFKP